MTRKIIVIVPFISLFCATLVQAEDEYHPFLTDKFNIDIGAFWPKTNFDMKVDGRSPGEEIDFDEVFNFKNYHTAASINFRWRFGKKWSFWAQGWDTSSSGKATLEEDIGWENVIFKSGSFVKGGIGVSVGRLFFGREFSLSPQHEFGMGAGLHWMELDTFIKGDVLINDGSIEFQRRSVSASFPLPNIGVWYMYSWSPKWVLQSRVDWLSASVGDYSGGLWDVQAGINYQAFRNVGFGLYYKAFILEVDVDKKSWHGNAELIQSGPVLTMTATW
ncbi:MAG: hypothetical protein IMF09_06975 [Proteobacteria bacterium]|nr:hypothetical protein [Pseudomonadota bacterium]